MCSEEGSLEQPYEISQISRDLPTTPLFGHVKRQPEVGSAAGSGLSPAPELLASWPQKLWEVKPYLKNS